MCSAYIHKKTAIAKAMKFFETNAKGEKIIANVLGSTGHIACK